MKNIPSKIESLFLSSTGTYLARYRTFFNDYLYRIILKRSKSIISNPDAMWCLFEEKLALIIATNPIGFAKDKTVTSLPFFDALCSASIIRQNPSIIDRVILIKGDCWIDPLVINYLDNGQLHIGSNIPQNVVKEWLDVKYDKETPHKNPQYLIKDALHALTDIFDPIKGSFEGSWEERFLEKQLAKEATKKSYLIILSKAFTPRTVGIALKEDKDFLIKDGAVMNKTLWRCLIRQKVKEMCLAERITSSSELRLRLIQDQINGLNFQSLAGDIAKEISSVFNNTKSRIHLKDEEIRKSLEDATKILPKHLDTDLPEWKLLTQHFIKTSKLQTLNISRKTLKTYEQCLVPMSLITEDYSIVSIHNFLRGAGVTEGAIRKLIVRLSKQELWNGTKTKNAHDSGVLIIAIIRFFQEVEQTPVQMEKISTKVVNLIVSEIAGSGPQEVSSSIGRMAHDASQLHLVDASKLTSLTILKSMLDVKKTVELEESLKTIQGQGLIIREDDFQLALAMDANPKKVIQISELDNWDTSRTPESKISSKKLMVELLPYNHITGLLGCLVSGICIDFAGKHHLDHRKDDCLNLIVRDNKKILLWGLVVHCKEEDFFLNNLQGGLPSRYSNLKHQLLIDIKDVLSKNGNTYTLPHWFNALDITQGLKKSYVKLPIRDLRLDVRTTEGFINELLFKIDKKTG